MSPEREGGSGEDTYACAGAAGQARQDRRYGTEATRDVKLRDDDIATGVRKKDSSLKRPAVRDQSAGRGFTILIQAMKTKFAILALVLMLSSLLAYADKEKKDEPQVSSEVKFQVVKADNGKPVRNAAVVLHPVTKQGWQSKKGFELKTDADGNTQMVVPYGKVRVQVIAPGFQTYGEDFDLSEPTKEIVIKLDRPKDQYSVYK